MKYSLALAFAAGALAATSKEIPGYGNVPSSSASSSAPATTPVPTSQAPPQQLTSTAFVTDLETIISCGPSVTNCPGSSTATPVIKTSETPKTTAPATSKPVTSETPKTTAPATSKPVTSETPKSSTPVTSEQSKTIVISTTPVASTTAPATSKPATSEQAKSSVPAPPVVVLSTQAIETCIPTTIYKTITVTSATASQQTTPVATSKAPYGTNPAGVPVKPTGGVASGTGVGPRPSTTAPIAQGSASGLTVSFGGMALAAAAAVLFA